MADPDQKALKRLIEYAADEAASSELFLTARLLRLAASSVEPHEIAHGDTARAEDAALLELLIGRQPAANKIFRREKLQ